MSGAHIGIYVQPKLTTELRMAPHIIQSIEILTLPAFELHNFVQEQLDTNPVLETKEPVGDEATEDKDKAVENKEEVNEERATQIDEEFLNNYENLEAMEEHFSENYVAKKFSDETDKKFEALQNTASRPTSLQDNLHAQLQLFDLSDKLLTIGQYIIYNIDERGYLRYTLEDVAESIGDCTMEEVEVALSCVQKLEPAGVGARDIQECLLLQLDPEEQNYEFQKLLIEKYLYDIYNNKYPKIVKETGKTLEEIKETITSLQKLNPKPGGELSIESSHFIVPDVVVEYLDGEYIIRLEEQYIPQLKINQTYRKLLKEDNSNAKDFVKKKMESANWVIDAIKQRQRTLYSVATEIIKHQNEFLDHGLTHLKPLKMQDVAETLDICVSTVSRAIAEKYAQTPRGIFPLKFFFTGAINKDGGENESRVSVKERIQVIIQQEDKQKPLSDEDISDKLKQARLNIARRTVTKYRKALGIPSSRRRKEY